MVCSFVKVDMVLREHSRAAVGLGAGDTGVALMLLPLPCYPLRRMPNHDHSCACQPARGGLAALALVPTATMASFVKVEDSLGRCEGIPVRWGVGVGAGAGWCITAVRTDVSVAPPTVRAKSRSQLCVPA